MKRFALITALAVGFICFCWPLYVPGLYNDDALYVLLAKSIGSGRWEHVYLPYPVPETHHLPGYPVLLWPFFIFGDFFTAARLLSVLSLLIGGTLLFLWGRRHTCDGIAAVMTGAFFFNATAVQYASALMAEPVFIACTMGLAYLLTREKPREGAEVGFLLGLIAILRPQGLFFDAAVISWWALNRSLPRYRNALIIAALLALPVYLRNALVPSEIPSYLSITLQTFKTQGVFSTFLGNLKAGLGITLVQMLYQVPVPENVWARKLLAWTLILSTLALVGLAARRYKTSPIVQLSALYIVMSLLGLAVWPLFNPRFSLPLLPFLLFCCVLALSPETKTARPWALTIFLILALVFNLKQASGAAKNASLVREKQAMIGFPETLQWVEANTQPSDVLVSAYAPTIYLYTNRKTLLFPLTSDESLLVMFLKKNQASYLIDVHNDLHMAMKGNVNGPGALWEKQFSVAYANTREGTNIYRLR